MKTIRATNAARYAALLFLLIPELTQAAVQASLNRTRIALNETVTLSLKATGEERSKQPMLSVLERDFHVIGTSQMSRQNWINGKVDSSVEWKITMQARRAGQLTVPPIRLGSEQSQPVALDVTQGTASTSVGKDGGKQGLQVQLIADREKAYVQAQVVLITRVLTPYFNLRKATLSDPQITNAIVESLGDTQFETLINGQRFIVFERRHAVFAQNSGILEIPPVAFRAAIPEAATAGNDPFQLFFRNRERPVQAQSQALRLEILPRPAQFPAGAYWLPAKEISLSETWSAQTQSITQGEPLTRIVTIKAQGLLSAQLPEIKLPFSGNIKTYPSSTEANDEKNAAGFIGKKIATTVVIPISPNKVETGEIRLPWWNTALNRVEVATLPARVFQVKPAANNASGSGQPAGGAMTRVEPISTHTVKSTTIWIAWTLAALGWLVCALLLWRQRRASDFSQEPMQRREHVIEKNAWSKLKRAFSLSDTEIRVAAETWRIAYREQAIGPRSKFEQRLAEILQPLNRVLYSKQSGMETTKQARQHMLQELAALRDETMRNTGGEKNALPKLYPA